MAVGTLGGLEERIEAVLGERALARLRRRRWLVRLFLALCGLALATAVAFWLARPAGGEIRWIAVPAKKGTLSVVVTATGTVQPRRLVEVSSELSGIVREVFVDFNSPVKKGQLLARLDTARLEARLASARARVQAARARVLEAEATLSERTRDLERKRELVGRRVAPPSELDVASAAFERARAALESAKADVAVAEAELRLVEVDLEKASILAPIDGVVLHRNVDPGQTVAATLQAPRLFTIAEDLAQMEVQVDVDEADVGRVRPGQPATFTVDAWPERRFSATIREVRFASELQAGVVTYKAILDVDNRDLALRPGMTATAEIAVQTVEDAVLVPNAALRFSPPLEERAERPGLLRALMPAMPRFRQPSPREETGPERTLWVLREGRPEPVRVEIGPTDGRETVIRGGLEPGVRVVTEAVLPRRTSG
ncbi:MAG: efflux RND transporter periplasmic adaptor subunit [Geminicoccaceae bacterium]|nr:efflux RND transporter periplasmic adaptor subunit [Geminicoccaceae bacterium]MCS7268665.1 efflux RND transporter periplasmic adaptor subunit [Geminicoccaceae bacterium]MCX7631433.1 efflux RND transporter periplasmic adaptor subunit [Geminicoccaceae bacterium]MDW8124728.1 efflux RND transporter periplasmic adaptor subunit [Geminicoccaceae bacterium]MDW8342813.1 efflux RND transporter periplasmic adaptor subunit [Geminicoccaceae bacterium]